MKRIRHSLDGNLRPLKLYLEDLEQLLVYLQDGAGTVQTVFSTRDMEYESLKEMCEHESSPLDQLTIRTTIGFDIRAWIRIDRSGAYLHSPNVDEMSELSFAAIERFLMSKQRAVGYQRLISLHRWLLSMALGFLFFVLLLTRVPVVIFVGQLDSWALVAWATIGFVFGSAISWLALACGNSRIYLEPSRKVVTFWRRNSDKIRLELISVIAGAILGLGATLLAQWLMQR